MDVTAATPTRGRPRDPRRREAILRAAMTLIGEVGYDRATVEAIAHRAGVSKPTIYRRWPNGKEEIVVEALRTKRAASADLPDTGSLRGDLIASFCGMGGLTDEQGVATFASVLTAISKDEAFAAAFRRDVLAPKIALTRAIYDRARDRGEIGEHVEIDLLAPALAGIILHRFFILGEHPTEDAIVRVIDQIILPAATSPARSGGR